MKRFDTMVNEVYISLRQRNIPIKNCPVTISNRLKRVFGTTYYKKRGNTETYNIKIAGYLVNNGSEHGIKSTIAHEFIHTCDGCLNHGALWKHYASMVSDLYNISRTNTMEDKGISQGVANAINNSNIKYIVKCTTCNHEWKYKRMCKTLKVINYCSCPYCKTTTLNLKVL